MIRRVLVANRGEIAVRIIRSCTSLRIETVAVHSDADRNGLWLALADRAVCIGPARATESYLNRPALVAAALGTSCDAVHPGYGFLAEDAEFARMCETSGLVFIGPSSETIAAMGNKISARTIARSAGIPTIPGSEGRLEEIDDARRTAPNIGYPLLLKAASGGGGRGMRVVTNAGELARSFAEAQAEAHAAFGDGTLYAERFLDRVRHIEVQVLADARGGAIALGERDCTLQRRAQKLFEEAPASVLPPRTRDELTEAAVALVQAIEYRSLGTVEFVYEPATERFYFLEMNTRIQVEHPVTEMISGLDLVAQQFSVAAGAPLQVRQTDVRLHGHALECRINAEDPSEDFRPSPATITNWTPPQGSGIRVDTHAYAGYTIPPYYDSLIAKLIVHGATRDEALERARGALASFRIDGPHTTLGFHARLLADSRVIENHTDTKWVEREFLLTAALA